MPAKAYPREWRAGDIWEGNGVGMPTPPGGCVWLCSNIPQSCSSNDVPTNRWQLVYKTVQEGQATEPESISCREIVDEVLPQWLTGDIWDGNEENLPETPEDCVWLPSVIPGEAQMGMPINRWTLTSTKYSVDAPAFVPRSALVAAGEISEPQVLQQQLPQQEGEDEGLAIEDDAEELTPSPGSPGSVYCPSENEGEDSPKPPVS